jgi:hypothetical protein
MRAPTGSVSMHRQSSSAKVADKLTILARALTDWSTFKGIQTAGKTQLGGFQLQHGN